MLNTLQRLEIFLLNLYKTAVSPILKTVFKGGCRYTPTCSEYSLSAIKKYGPFKGLSLAIIRFLRCNPLSKHDHHYPLE